MIDLLWAFVAALAAASAVAVRDVDVRWRSHRVGRPLFGLFVLGGLATLYLFVWSEGYVPWPGFLVGLFAIAYLPFLSSTFIDLETTDSRALDELETLLLTRDFRQLLNASDERVLEHGRRRLRLHWEGREEDGCLVLELDVHPSLFPLTVSRPHVAVVLDQLHLEHVREDVRRRRGAGRPPVDQMSPADPEGRKA